MPCLCAKVIQVAFVYAAYRVARSNGDIASHLGRTPQAVRLITLKGREAGDLPHGDSIARREHAQPLAPWRPGSTEWNQTSAAFRDGLNDAQREAVCEERAVRNRRAFEKARGKAGASRRWTGATRQKQARRAEEQHQAAQPVPVAAAPATASGQTLGGDLSAAVSEDSSSEQGEEVAAPQEPAQAAQQPGKVVGGFTPINAGSAQAGPSRLPSPPVPSSRVAGPSRAPPPRLPQQGEAPATLPEVAPPLLGPEQAPVPRRNRSAWLRVVMNEEPEPQGRLRGIGPLELREGMEPMGELKGLWSAGGRLYEEEQAQQAQWRTELGYR